MKTLVRFVEIVPDPGLRRLEKKATGAFRRFFPSSPVVKLYRTADGRIGCQMQITLAPGDRKRLQDAYRAVMRVLGEKRGRPTGVKTVQAKLHLPERVYRALKKAAADSGSTMSNLAAASIRVQLQRRSPTLMAAGPAAPTRKSGASRLR